jgi:hypothetical protein
MANPLKILANLSASAGLAVSGSAGLQVQQGNVSLASSSEITQSGGVVKVNGDLQVSSGHFKVGNNVESLVANASTGFITAQAGFAVSGSTTTSGSLTVGGNGTLTAGIGTFNGQLNANGGVVVTDSALQVSNGGISGSATLQIGGASTLAGGATVTGGALNASAVAVSASALNVTNNATVGGSLTVTGDLQVQGSLNAVNRTDLYVTDKVILVASGSANAAAASGAGLAVSIEGVSDPSFTWDQTGKWVSTEDLDLASGKVLKINNTEVLSSTALGSGVTASSLTSVGTITSLTASALNVSGRVELGDAAGDVVAVAGQLTASQGVDIATGKALSIGGKGVVGDLVFSLSGQGGGANSYVSASYVSYGSQNQAVYIGHISASNYQLDTDFMQLAFNGSPAQDYGVAVDSESIFLGGGGLGNGVSVLSASSNVAVRGQYVHLGAGNIENAPSLTASVNGLLQVATDGETFSFVTVGTSQDERGNTFNSIDVLGAFNQLDSKLNEVSGAVGGAGPSGIGTGDYYSLRGTWVQGVNSGYSGVYTVKFSGSSTGNAANGYYVPAIAGLTASSESDLLDRLGHASFDIASRDSGSTRWTNDLISLQVSASQEGSTGYWYPIFEITAPALSYDSNGNVKLRLIVVNEKANVLA